MNKETHLKKIGFVSKLNGFRGELVIASDDENFIDEPFLFMKMDGIAVPFFVEDIFEKGGNVIVKFEDVDDESQGSMYLNKEVFIEQHEKEKPAISIKDLVNYHIVDASFGDLGPILRIDEFPQQEIAVCEVNEKQILIPLNNDFIDEIDDENRQIMMSLPDGLIDLYLKS